MILLHDPELLLALPGILRLRRAGAVPVTVWDVHEDTAAALAMKGWVPRPLRPLCARRCGRPSGWPSAGCGCCSPRTPTRTGSGASTPSSPTSPPRRPGRPRGRATTGWSTWASCPGRAARSI
ncbi:hypothetical protein ACFQ3Z_37220 [Streptomyces nogalater]